MAQTSSDELGHSDDVAALIWARLGEVTIRSEAMIYRGV